LKTHIFQNFVKTFTTRFLGLFASGIQANDPKKTTKSIQKYNKYNRRTTYNNTTIQYSYTLKKTGPNIHYEEEEKILPSITSTLNKRKTEGSLIQRVMKFHDDET